MRTEESGTCLWQPNEQIAKHIRSNTSSEDGEYTYYAQLVTRGRKNSLWNYLSKHIYFLKKRKESANQLLNNITNKVAINLYFCSSHNKLNC